jgi:uncharacterized iron-regulated membrane protein
MTQWQQWVQRPQSLWFRKAVFQIHLWVGIGIGIYVLVISISGSAIVFRRELAKKYAPKTIILSPADSRRLTTEELERYVQQSYPGYEVLSIRRAQHPDLPDDVILERRSKRIERLFDPYTAADLGDPQSATSRWLQWLVDLHDNLLSGQTGRLLNGIGAFLLTILSLTGAFIWWPGAKNWRRSTMIHRKANFARFNWDLHSAIGFWCSLLVLVWGLSGICLCFPGVLASPLGGELRFWITNLHFGRFNTLTELLWTIVGFAPATLAVTGALMWWNRVLRKKLRRSQTGHLM